MKKKRFMSNSKVQVLLHNVDGTNVSSYFHPLMTLEEDQRVISSHYLNCR